MQNRYNTYGASPKQFYLVLKVLKVVFFWLPVYINKYTNTYTTTYTNTDANKGTNKGTNTMK